ncbi:MAG: aldehyde ferredoxin oxidoreductase C-terminal domain-containing protein, partial [Candidatus Bathyarchaeia archaeon]
LILCKFCGEAYSGYDDFAKLYSLVTGLEITSDEMRLTAERIVNLTRLFNIREGLGRRDDMLPWKVMNVPIPGKGPSHIASISQQELNMMLEDYYLAREWNEKGVPKLEKLKELGLEEFANIVDAKFVKA